MDVLWCITGGGYMLEESCRIIEKLAEGHRVTVAFSEAGKEVAKAYGCASRISKAACKVLYEHEQGYSSPVVGRLGSFDFIVISPCTANTTAKIALGIADSLVSNIAAQAVKSGRRVVVVPTDLEKKVSARIPSGRRIGIRCRKIDLENVRRLKRSGEVEIAANPDEAYRLIQNVD
jgi:flavoprotein